MNGERAPASQTPCASRRGDGGLRPVLVRAELIRTACVLQSWVCPPDGDVPLATVWQWVPELRASLGEVGVGQAYAALLGRGC